METMQETMLGIVRQNSLSEEQATSETKFFDDIKTAFNELKQNIGDIRQNMIRKDSLIEQGLIDVLG